MLSILILVIIFSQTVGQRSALSKRWQRYSSRSHSVIYEETLENFKYGAEKLVLLEIGVQSSGIASARMNWFNDVSDFVYVGLSDSLLNVETEKGGGSIHFEIGSQSNPTVLSTLCSSYGPFDVVIDRNVTSSAKTAIETLESLFPCLKSSAFYFLEEPVRTVQEGNGMTIDVSVSNYLSHVYSLMHHWWSDKIKFFDSKYSGLVKSIQLADSILVLERGLSAKYELATGGTEKVPYESSVLVTFLLDDGRLLSQNITVGNYSTNIPHKEINQSCRETCVESEYFVGKFDDVDHCVRTLKEQIIRAVYFSYEDFLQDDEA